MKPAPRLLRISTEMQPERDRFAAFREEFASKVLAMEYGRYGIRINTMAPGGTEIADRVAPRGLIRPGVTVPDIAEAETKDFQREMAQDIRNQQALRRRGLPEEQAAAIAFLASDDASFITGQVINCSGGQS